MKIATWNVNSLRVRLDHVRDWLKSEEPDVLGLQETKLTDDKFPIAEFEELGYRCAFSGQPTYNGVALITREPATDVVTSLDGFEDPQRRVLGATVAGVRVLNLYVPNGQSVDSDKYEYKLGWLTALTAQLRSDLDRDEHVVVMGDFNIAPADQDVHDPAGRDAEDARLEVLMMEPIWPFGANSTTVRRPSPLQALVSRNWVPGSLLSLSSTFCILSS